MKPFVLIDVSFLAYRAWYTMGGLQYEGESTGIIYGVLEQLRKICYHPQIDSNRVVAFFDSRQSHRKQEYPRYKHGRQQEDRTEEEWAAVSELKEQIELLREEVLPVMGVTTYRQTGLEADDLIAWVARYLEDQDRQHHNDIMRAVIVSADSDLLQCISTAVYMFNPNKNEMWVVGDVIQQKGVTPKQWGLVKVLAGCDSDGVSGVPGWGEKTAVEYLRGTLCPECAKYRALAEPEMREIIERNKKLVLLPHRRTKPIDLKDPVYSPCVFFDLCHRFGFQSYTREGPRRSEWLGLFSGHMNIQPVRKRGQRTIVEQDKLGDL